MVDQVTKVTMMRQCGRALRSTQALDDGFCCRFWRYFGVGFGDRSGIVLVLSLAIVLGIVLVLV